METTNNPSRLSSVDEPQYLKIKHRWLVLANGVNFYATVYCLGLAVDGEPRSLVPAALMGGSLIVTMRAMFKYEGWR